MPTHGGSWARGCETPSPLVIRAAQPHPSWPGEAAPQPSDADHRHGVLHRPALTAPTLSTNKSVTAQRAHSRHPSPVLAVLATAGGEGSAGE